MKPLSAVREAECAGVVPTGITVVVIAIELVGAHAFGRVRMKVIPDAKTVTLKEFLITSISPGSEVVTDGFLAYRKSTVGYEHTVHVVDGSGHQAHELLSAVHRVASLVKRWINATHQGGTQEEHLSAYLDEFTFRFNQRRSRAPGMLFYRLIQATVNAPATTYRQIAQGLVTKETPLPGRTGPHSQPRTLALTPLDRPWREGPQNG